MAALYVGVLRAKQPRGPYYIGGYSFGGLVALEMARLLGRENVAGLVMIDAYAHPHTWPFYARARVRARKLLGRARAFARAPLEEGKAFLKRRATDRATYVNNWLGAVNPDLPLPLRQTAHRRRRGADRLHARAYDGRVNFIRAGRTGAVFPASARAVWGGLIAELEIETTAGDHGSILGRDAPALAKKISALLSSPGEHPRHRRGCEGRGPRRVRHMSACVRPGSPYPRAAMRRSAGDDNEA